MRLSQKKGPVVKLGPNYWGSHVQKIAIFAVAALLSGCTTYDTALRNEAGAITECKQSGWGLIGGAIASSQHNECIKNAHAAGYSEMPSARK